MFDEERAALLIGSAFRAPELGESIEKQERGPNNDALWRWTRMGHPLRSVYAAHWASAGYQFYMWDHVANEREARGVELMVLSAIYPLGVRFIPSESSLLVRPEQGEPFALPTHVQMNSRLQADIDYLRQIMGLVPLTASDFVLRYDQAAPVDHGVLPTSEDFDSADRALAAAEHEVDS